MSKDNWQNLLNNQRNEIDRLDTEIIKLLEQRFDKAANIAKIKSENDIPVFDPSREEQVFNNIVRKISNDRYNSYIRNTYASLMNSSKDMQKDILDKINASEELSAESVSDGKVELENKIDYSKCKIVYQGVPGSYSEEALKRFFPDDVETINVNEFSDTIKYIREGKADYGILPVENSSTGSVNESVELLSDNMCYIVGEVILPVVHNFAVKKGTKIENIKEVYSHEQGFLQCRDFLSQHPDWKTIPYLNTAIAAKHVSEDKDFNKAVIASSRAADIYGLEILQHEINKKKINSTRFAVFTDKFIVEEKADKISVMLTLPHKSGSLYNMLKILADKGLNMIKIESRPMPDRNWEYVFYIDFEGNICENRCVSALKEIKNNSGFFKIMGNYKKDDSEVISK